MNARGGTLVDGDLASDSEPRSDPDRQDPRWIGRWLIAAVRAYQVARSGRPTGCRYLPTCSEYAIEAISEHGPARGSAMAARRVLRCTPWGGHGIDPVPTGRTTCTHH